MWNLLAQYGIPHAIDLTQVPTTMLSLYPQEGVPDLLINKMNNHKIWRE